jgi:glycosyltransferase involved in cell wall biosynthesis
LKPRLVVIGPLPPPYHGVSVSTSLVLANPQLRSRFAVEHFDTSDHRTISNVGRWDVRNVIEAVAAVRRLWLRLRGAPGIVYFPISQGLPGLTRDTLFVRVASVRGWTIAAHLRGSELGEVYRHQPRLIRSWLHRAFRRIDSLAVLGESVRDVMDGIIPTNRIAVVPNGAPDPGARNGSRGHTGLYLGNLRPRKGTREALEAALLVTRQRPEARFVFAGDSPDAGFRRELEELAAQSQGRITVRPPVFGRQKDELLLSSAFLLFPPVQPEGHPRVVIEAIAAGLPVITTDRGVIAETVIDRECGYVLASPVPSELAARMIRLYERPELLESMGRAARARYLERFTQELADRALADWLADLKKAA